MAIAAPSVGHSEVSRSQTLSYGRHRITAAAHVWRTDMDGSIEATRVLRDLLIRNPQYRAKWQQFAQRLRTEEVSQAAVAQVIAMYLWDSGERDDTETDLARRLRHRVRRALSGDQLTGETLTWMVQAFGMTQVDEQRLWQAFAGDNGRSEGIFFTVDKPRELVKPQWHRTVSLFERYELTDARTLPSRHTMHVIRAADGDVDFYLSGHGPIATSIEVVAGGRLGRRYEYGDWSSDEIVLSTPIRKGYVTSLEYRTHYPADWCPLEVRRAVRGRCENVDMAVQFNVAQLPASVSFCAWPDHYDGKPVFTEEIKLDAQGFAHRFVPYAEQTVLGFMWSWPTQEAGTPLSPSQPVG